MSCENVFFSFSIYMMFHSLSSETANSKSTLFHISDVHIRLNSRKEEYEQVFERLYSVLRSHPKVQSAAIVITGDLLHNKLDLTPECILMSYSFLARLGAIAPTFLIAGNHDALLNNLERVDSLTSILHERTPEGVYYLKYTGYYRYSNLVFAVNSLLGSGIANNSDTTTTTWLDLSADMRKDPVFFENSIRVALFHGSIAGWRNNLGFCSPEGDKKDSDFVGYDLVLLGDIHKYQYMNKERTMAYSGSLVSQNFGETDPDHGLLVWDLATRSSELIRIPNPFCYCEAVLEEQSLRVLYQEDTIPILEWRNVDTLRKYLPECCNLRIHLTEDSSINHDFISTFKKALPRARLQQRHASHRSSGSDTTSVQNRNKFSPGNADEMFWIRAFVLEKLRDQPLSLIEKLIEELVAEYRKNVQQKNPEGHACWALETLVFSNMFGYGKNNRIDFTKMQPNTITGIFGRNSYGKSTIIDILTFMLFGKITRGTHGNSIPKEIIHREEKKASGEIIFGVGNQRYRIVKECTRQKNDKIKIVETFFIWDGRWCDYSEEQRKKTDKVIESLLGSCEGFLYTNVCLQQREKQFRDMTQKERKEFLYSLFGLDWFEKYRKEKEDEWKAIKGGEKVYQAKLGNQTTHEWEEEASSYHANIRVSESELVKLSTAIADIEKERDKMMALQKPSDYTSLEEALTVQKQLKRRMKDTVEEEKRLSEEMVSLQTYLSIHDEKTILSELRRLDELIVSMEQSVSTVREEGPEIRRWIVRSSREEWMRENERIMMFLGRSESIDRAWSEEKTRIEKQILGLEAETARLVYDMDQVVDSDHEWEALCIKASKAEQEMTTLETRLSRETTEEEENKDTDAVEDVLQEVQRLLYEHKSVECKIQMLRQNVRETKTMEFNPDCRACTRNPYFLQQTEREKALHSEEMTGNKLLQVLEDKRRTVCSFLAKMGNHQVDLVGLEMEKLHDLLRSGLQKRKEQRMEAIKKREQSLKKLQYYKNVRTRYENTKSYHDSRRHKTAIEELQREMASSVKKSEYNELTRLIKNASVYEKIRLYWEKNKGGASSLEELRREKEGWDKKQEEWSRKKQRWGDVTTEVLEMGKRKMRGELDMEELQKQMEALMENEKTAVKRKECEARRSSLRKEKEECLEKQHGWKTSLESLMIRKKEWEINSKMWKECQEKSRMLQCLMDCINRDGLPLYLLRMYLPIIEDDINMLIHTFLDKKLVLRVQEDNVIVGLQGGATTTTTTTTTTAPSNYMGGMESFIVDLSVKMGFAKYSRLPQSNFFIIDEGISVFDQERIANIYVLFNFLTSISEHVFLISHLPTIKDFVSQSIEIDKDSEQKSHLTCCF